MTKVKKRKTKEIEKEEPIILLPKHDEEEQRDLSWMIQDNDIKEDKDGKKTVFLLNAYCFLCFV